MRTVTFKLPQHLEESIDRLARLRGVSRSAVIREALEAYVVEPKKSALDRAGDLVGAFDGLPPDLSTNPKYMEGFGAYRPPRRRPNRRPA